MIQNASQFQLLKYEDLLLFFIYSPFCDIFCNKRENNEQLKPKEESLSMFIARHCTSTNESHGPPHIPTKQSSLWPPTYRPTTNHETHTASHWTPSGQCHTSTSQGRW